MNTSVMGAKLRCAVCGAEAVVTRRGTGTARCHDTDLAPVSGVAGRTAQPATGNDSTGTYDDEEGHS